jgi:ADP-ribose pyrophosphatase YjhB (NUDIX family)
MQRYTVFLNDKVVTIHQNINIVDDKSNRMLVNYTDKPALVKVYKRFYEDSDCFNLVIHAANKYAEACDAFNSMFRRIRAAGGIVRNQDQEFLFIKRSGIWDLPKGKLNKNEGIQEGALREVTEETGLRSLTVTKKLPSTYHIYTDKQGKEILKETFWFEMMCYLPQKPVPQLEEDITEVKWFSGSDLNIAIKSTYASLRQLLLGYQGLC